MILLYSYLKIEQFKEIFINNDIEDILGSLELNAFIDNF